MNEMLAVNLAGDVVASDENLGIAIIKTVGIDTKEKPHEDKHVVALPANILMDLKGGEHIELIGTIKDKNNDQYIEAIPSSIKLGGSGYRNLAKAVGITDQTTSYFERKVDENTKKVQQPLANVRLVAMGTKVWGTVFNKMASDFMPAKCPMGSEVCLYGRMRRKELVSQDGSVRKFIDIATDDWHFPGLSKVIKKGEGGKDEFAGMGTEMLAFVSQAKPVEKPKPAKGKGRKVS
jgi:hypothetical protein